MKGWLFFIWIVVVAALSKNVCLAQQAGTVGATDRYWISYTAINPRSGPCCLPAGPKYLMQIDALGNVVVPPKKVVSVHMVASPHQAPTTIGHRGLSTLNMWLINKKREVVRVKIAKRTLSVLSFKNTGRTIGNDGYLEVTQKSCENFLVSDLETQEGFMPTAFAISSRGGFTGDEWNLSQNPFVFDCFDSFRCGPGISADGRMAILAYDTDKSRLLLQHLSLNGKPKGSPAEIFSSRTSKIFSFDISEVLNGSTRFLVYVQAIFRINEPRKEVLYLQVVDAKTGAKIGDRIRLGTPFTNGRESVAVDTLGRFLIYRILSSPSSRTDLAFQALDATGHASGPPKVIATDVESGVDILKE